MRRKNGKKAEICMKIFVVFVCAIKESLLNGYCLKILFLENSGCYFFQSIYMNFVEVKVDKSYFYKE